jgi:hypothetical protein
MAHRLGIRILKVPVRRGKETEARDPIDAHHDIGRV